MERRKVLFCLALLSAFSTSLFSMGDSSAQAVDDLNQLRESSARVSFVPPGDDSPSPRQTQSGASRLQMPGICGGLPLLPKSGVGLTTDSSPSIFVYFAEGTTVENAILTLKSLDEAESEYYETLVNIPREKLSDSGGVVAFEMPEVASELSLNEEYQWSLALTCEGSVRPDSPFLRGYLKRVDAGLDMQANNTSLVDIASAYGDAGIWYDLLATLATLRLEEPDDAIFAEYWEGVMESAGLESIANVPLIADK